MTTGLPPATRDRGLHAQVVDVLGQEIVDERLAPASILNLDALAVRFSVSRSVLREALRVLQSLGMVEPRQRTGTQVLPRASWDLMSPQVILWRGRGPEYYTQMRELLELRLGLEPVAARLGAQALDPLQAALVREAARTMVEAGAAGDGRRYLEADVAFHTALLRGSGNQVTSRPRSRPCCAPGSRRSASPSPTTRPPRPRSTSRSPRRWSPASRTSPSRRRRSSSRPPSTSS